MAGIFKEVWIKQIMEKFYPDSSFLKPVVDMSRDVNNDAINLADAGIDPRVLINNKAYPITIVLREDTPISITLDKFETENTLIVRPDELLYSYAKLESVLKGHRATLQAICGMKAAYAYAPGKDGEKTPVIETTGASANGRKRLCTDDILNLKERYDDYDIPLEDRYIVLNPRHVSDLIKEDMKLFKELTNIKEGVPFKFAGFGMFQFSKTPCYKKSGEAWVKDDYGVNGNNFSSFAFHAKEVMKADGQIHLYSRRDDPQFRGTIVGFDKRFIALPIGTIKYFV